MNTRFFPGLLIVLSLAFLVPGTGGKDFPGQGDEVMHLVTVQQSLASKSYIVPVVDGVPNYYKPPLLFWAGMVTEAVLGPGLFGPRFSSILFTTGIVLLMYYLMVVWGVRPWVAVVASIAYLCSIGTMKFGRLLMMEQGMAFFYLLFVFLLLEHYRTGRIRPLIVSGLISGIGFLFKGPVFLIYCAFTLIIWASMRIVRFKTDPVRITGLRKFWPTVRTGLIFSAFALVVPVIWAGSVLLFAGVAGKAMLAYFFIVENAGKFAQQDQSEIRILVGWIIYTFPWTVVLFAGLYFALRSRYAYGKIQIAGRLLLMTVVVTTIFHFIPNRKAAYYGIPFAPLLFAGLPMMLRDNSVLERWSRLSLIVLYIVMPALVVLTWLGSDSPWSLLLLIPVVAGIFIDIRAKRDSNFLNGSFATDRRLKTLSVAGVLVILVLQFVLYPLLNKEVIPVGMSGRFASKMCVISTETWDAMD
ncbi:MAG TPA: glycosyltransferase family 39 protein, partial [Leptospiraceae bacterium]|nr:glycosyltransferase family 39 protein [Leptospiraceae bacterium]